MTINTTVTSLATNNYEKRIIIFIDILGFKNYINDHNSIEGVEKIKLVLKKFQDECSDGSKTEWGAFRKTFTVFSDTIIITVPLDIFYTGLLFTISTFAFNVQVHLLKNGLLSRGCLHIGDIYHNGNIWFGPGLVEAHIVESTMAKNPRIVLTKIVVDYFSRDLKNLPDFIIKDKEDECFFIDYLGWIGSEVEGYFPNDLKKVKTLIVNNIEKLKGCSDQRALKKWIWLANYFNNYCSSSKLIESYGDDLPKNIVL